MWFDALNVQVLPGIWEADIKAAVRRMPFRRRHRWAAVVVFRAEGKARLQCASSNLSEVWVSVHYACPFGALSSVHGWERTGRLLTTLARKILHLPTDRYVDDLFGAERY